MVTKLTKKTFRFLMSGSLEQEKDAPNRIYSAGLEAFLRGGSALKDYQKIEGINYGIERCLYELNPELACLSPSLIHHGVLTPPDVLFALEDLATQAERPSFPIDNHLGAFLISRWKGLRYKDLQDLRKPQRELRNLGALRLLASIQVSFKIKGLPNLCQWMADLCEPLTDRYRNLKARECLQAEIAHGVCSGQLNNLVQIFENSPPLREDESDYQAAKIELLLIESELKEMEGNILNRNQFCLEKPRGMWERLFFAFNTQKHSYASKKDKKRALYLYQQWQNLREIWGESLVFKGNASKDSWRSVWSKILAFDPPKANSKKR